MSVNQDPWDFQNSLWGLAWIVGQTRVPVRNIGRARSLERVVLASHRIGREKVSGLGEVAKCVVSTGVQHARAYAHAYAHTHVLANGRRGGRRSTLDSKSVGRMSTYVVEVKREREREKRESDRKTRTSGTEVRGASFPSDMPGCLLVLSHRLRPTSPLPLRTPHPFSDIHSLFSFLL